ncbi:MAG: DUF5700 domain-containing putative Zn-dependent protease [Bacteroidota bacterium]
MKKILLIILSLSLIGCKAKTENSESLNKKLKYSLNAVELALDISRKIERNNKVTDQEWEDLFSSVGYQTYFCGFNREVSEPQLKEVFYTVFEKSRAQKLDSILQAPVEMSMEGRFNLMVQNFNEFKKNRAAIQQFMANIDFDSLLKDANELTLKFLPKNVDTDNVELHEVSFVMMEPNAYVTDCGLVVDFNNAFQMGEEGLTETLAHEYHHNYRNSELSISGEPLIQNLSGLQAEGIADLIDKGLPPYESMLNIPQNIVEAMNEMYANTPQILHQLDTITIQMLSNELSEMDYDAKTMRYFKDGGHANGLYMSNKIKEAGLYQQMIDTYNDPIAFLELYNQAVEGQVGEHRFSDGFMTYVKDLQLGHEKELESVSDETFEVTFVVEVPNVNDEVFITGNQSNLGEWDPGAVKLDLGAGNSRTIKLQLQSPAEFKFTRGSWKKEAIMNGKNNNDNLTIKFEKDTIVSFKIKQWTDEFN